MVSRNVLGFCITPNMKRVMEINGCYASIMRAEKKSKTSNGNLPLGMPIPLLPVDFLKNRPDFWVGGMGSYVCPVESDWALWFNWSMNGSDISILTSVKGMNPITGQRTNGLNLEQYENNCPIHDKKFQHDRFCPECNFKWPTQNYIASPNQLFWDGFRSSDGNVRQFYFTEDMSKSVPELVIGKEDTVPAFGFCFFKTKQYQKFDIGGKKIKDKFPKETFGTITSLGYSVVSGHLKYKSTPSSILIKNSSRSDYTLKPDKYTSSVDTTRFHTCVSTPTDREVPLAVCACNMSMRDSTEPNNMFHTSVDMESMITNLDCLSERNVDLNAEVGIGAGEEIKQQLIKDRKSIDEWQTKPTGIIRLYFVFREQFEQMVSNGLNDLSGFKEGYLDSIPVGGQNE